MFWVIIDEIARFIGDKINGVSPEEQKRREEAAELERELWIERMSGGPRERK